MKKLLFSITALALSTVLFAQETQKTIAPASDVQKKKASDVAQFKTETIDLGKIKQGNPTTAIFSVANIGKEALIIEQANPTCGCTISDYTKEPIAVGKTGTIKATYNAANVGAFEKHLTVKFAGVDEVKSITIKGEVLPKEVAPTPVTDAASAAKPVTEEKTATTTTTTTTTTTKTPAKTEEKKKQ